MSRTKLIFIFLIFLLVYCANCLGLGPIPIEQTIDITNKKISIVGGFASNLLIIDEGTGKGKKFFKEQKFCGQTLDIGEIIDFYFEKVLQNTNNDEKHVVLEKLSESKNLSKFMNMGWIHYKNSPLYLFLNSLEYCGNIIGIPSPVSSELEKILPDFLKYASREIMSIKIENGESIQNYPNGILRSLATYKLAKLLNLSDIIVKTEYAAIKQAGKKDKIGILMENANGINQDEFFSSSRKILPSFQRELASLYVFDAICMQNDRNPSNYMCKTNKSGDAVGVVAFDNDCSFPCNTNLVDFFFFLRPILTLDGKIDFPYMDEELVRNILSIDFNVVSSELQNLITKYEIHALIVRIKKIQDAIKKTMKENEHFLLKKEQWSDDTLKTELSEKYKKTYLKGFLKLK